MTSRAYVHWLNQRGSEERPKIQEVLDARFHGGPGQGSMVGHVDIELAREPEAWRVVSAIASGGSGQASDWRPQVIEALKEAGIPVAHP